MLKIHTHTRQHIFGHTRCFITHTRVNNFTHPRAKIHTHARVKFLDMRYFLTHTRIKSHTHTRVDLGHTRYFITQIRVKNHRNTCQFWTHALKSHPHFVIFLTHIHIKFTHARALF